MIALTAIFAFLKLTITGKSGGRAVAKCDGGAVAINVMLEQQDNVVVGHQKLVMDEHWAQH